MKTAHGRTSVANALEIYFQEINQTPLLSAEQEQILARRIAQGDLDARNQMVRANLRLVVQIARKYVGRGLSLADLIEEGNLGLLRAAERFVADKNTRFSTYATFWIRQSMTRALTSSSRTVRIPAYMVTLIAKWRRAETSLHNRLGRAPTESEIARAINIPPKKLDYVRYALAAWNGDAAEDSDAEWIDHVVVDDRCGSPDEQMTMKDRLNELREHLESLEQRDVCILKKRFGLDQNQPQTLKEIGDELGLSRERVRQLADQALSKLSSAMLVE